MSLVFGSLFLFILISPGLLYRFAYLQGAYGKLTFKVSAVEEFFWALVPAFFFQIVSILVIEKIFGYRVRLDLIYQLITGKDSIDFLFLDKNLFPFLLYITGLIILSIFCGVLTRKFVRKYQLDLKFKFLRFGNEWHYLFSGEIFYQTRKINPDTIFFIQVDVVMSSSEGDMIYSGTLEDFYLSKDNGLDRIYLRNVYRRSLKNDLSSDKPNVGYLNRIEDERYYAMPGDLFVITYNRIVNLNITYITLENPVESDEPAVE
jgi:hypothetical protein